MNDRPEIPTTNPILLEVTGFSGREPTQEFLEQVSLARAWLSTQKPTKSTLVAPDAAVRSAGEWLERHHLDHVTELSAQVLVAACLIEGFPVKQSKRQPDHSRLGISKKTMVRDSTQKLAAKRARKKRQAECVESERIRAVLRRRYKQLERWKKCGSPPATRPWFVSPPSPPAPAPVFPAPLPDCLNLTPRKVEPPQAPLPSDRTVTPPVAPPIFARAAYYPDPQSRKPRLVARDGELL